ncbi:MAG: Ezrin/radixin/moesin family protein [Cyclobacteriaceae bacterium]|jgi:vacuolar-type H+-ATPase subunit I/STV1|nr:Ezrin/radixin/moesin family protein [Cyclobacteriaceae bacterium]
MKTKVIIICLALIFSGMQVFAQLSKQEKKEWKKKAKEYSKNPQELKSFTEAKQTTESDNASLKNQVTALNKQVSDKNARIAELEDQLSRSRNETAAAKAQLAEYVETSSKSSMDFSRGVVFKVQIGAFKNKDLSKYFDNNPNFGGEATEKGEQRFTIGIFRDYWEADKFKKYMREMGVKDAWIVPYKDGVRVEIKDVLEGVTIK